MIISSGARSGSTNNHPEFSFHMIGKEVMPTKEVSQPVEV
jgi:hypothetical protein